MLDAIDVLSNRLCAKMISYVYETRLETAMMRPRNQHPGTPKALGRILPLPQRGPNADSVTATTASLNTSTLRSEKVAAPSCESTSELYIICRQNAREPGLFQYCRRDIHLQLTQSSRFSLVSLKSSSSSNRTLNLK